MAKMWEKIIFCQNLALLPATFATKWQKQMLAKNMQPFILPCKNAKNMADETTSKVLSPPPRGGDPEAVQSRD
jgi:hypothetical protein